MERKIGIDVLNSNDFVFLNKKSIVDCITDEEIKEHEKEIEKIMEYFGNKNIDSSFGMSLFMIKQYIDIASDKEKLFDFNTDINLSLQESVNPYTGVDYYLNKDRDTLICYSFENNYKLNNEIHTRIKKVSYMFLINKEKIVDLKDLIVWLKINKKR